MCEINRAKSPAGTAGLSGLAGTAGKAQGGGHWLCGSSTHGSCECRLAFYTVHGRRASIEIQAQHDGNMQLQALPAGPAGRSEPAWMAGMAQDW